MPGYCDLMRALICDRYGSLDDLRVGEMPDPRPGPGSVSIEVEAAVVNFADILMVRGQYQIKPDPPFAPGYEVAGSVVESNQSPFSPGDRVAGFAPFGAFAEKAALQASDVVLLPDTLSFEVGATLPAGYGTSYHALVDRARLQPDETLLVLGASGGVGMAAVQIGRVIGAQVIAAVSTEEKADAALANGAHQVIRYDETPIREAIEELTGGDGVDVVFDPIGGETTEKVLRSTSWNGRLLVVGFAAGDIPRIPLNLPLLKGNAIVGVFWGRFTREEPEASAANLTTLVEWADQGKINPLIQHAYTLDEGVDALKWVAGRNVVGRVIIRP